MQIYKQIEEMLLLKLYADETPLTVANFVSLAEGDNPKLADSLKGRRVLRWN